MKHELYMQRCFQLARLAGSAVGKNPNVGAVLVYKDRIIGEGYHRKFGQAHAEVNAINSVSKEDEDLISKSILYVSLEPCNIHRKTPPCSELILRKGIKTIVVGCEDPNPAIAGSSLTYLESKGVKCLKNICEKEARQLIAPFRINVLEKRPYVSIKFAQSQDFFISKEGEQTWLSSPSSKIFSHKLRSLNQGILIGSKTAIIDNPALTNRLYFGYSPLRICIDPNNSVPEDSALFKDKHPTLIINLEARETKKMTAVEQWSGNLDLSYLLNKLYKEKDLSRLLVEGGQKTIQHFLDANFWDQAFVIKTDKKLGSGVKAPNINGRLMDEFALESDTLVQICNGFQ